MGRMIAAAALAALVALPSPARAWGFEAHQFIAARAIALLPPEIRPMFEANRAVFVERSVDPDTWRTAGFANEEPNHFLDLDWRSEERRVGKECRFWWWPAALEGRR